MFSVSVLRTFLGDSRRALSDGLSGDVSSLGKAYLINNEQFSAIVILIELGSAPNTMQIASVYGNFDHAILGNSFNLPPAESVSTIAPVSAASASSEVDMTLQQMTVYKHDEAGSAFFQLPNGPPPCEKFNYALMTMDVQEGKFSLKPRGWTSGKPMYTLDVSKMSSMPMTALSTPELWCKNNIVKMQSVVPRSTEQGGGGTVALIISVLTVIATIAWAILIAASKARYYAY